MPLSSNCSSHKTRIQQETAAGDLRSSVLALRASSILAKNKQCESNPKWKQHLDAINPIEATLAHIVRGGGASGSISMRRSSTHKASFSTMQGTITKERDYALQPVAPHTTWTVAPPTPPLPLLSPMSLFIALSLPLPPPPPTLSPNIRGGPVHSSVGPSST